MRERVSGAKNTIFRNDFLDWRGSILSKDVENVLNFQG